MVEIMHMVAVPIEPVAYPSRWRRPLPPRRCSLAAVPVRCWPAPSMAQAEAAYACHCLNVRIRSAPPNGPPPPCIDSDFKPLYVGDEGIAVVSPIKKGYTNKC